MKLFGNFRKGFRVGGFIPHRLQQEVAKNWVRVFTESDIITGSDRIGPEIGLFLCLTDCFFFTRMVCIKDYVFSAICMHLNI